MSRYSGSQGTGAARRTRATKRAEAAERDTRTLPERRKQPHVPTSDADRALMDELWNALNPEGV